MKELNIFYKAPFGKLYKTRSGKKAVFVGRKSKYLYYLIIEGSPKYLTYFEYGRRFEDNDSNELSDYDIVGEWNSTIKKENNIDKECINLCEYIPKSPLVVEIEKLISNGKLKCQQSLENNDEVIYAAWSEHIATCGKILSLINSLEVKEVDLKNSMVCKVDWYDGFLLDYTQEQQDELLKKIGADVGDKIRIILMKE
jgi:hypothetical protein